MGRLRVYQEIKEKGVYFATYMSVKVGEQLTESVSVCLVNFGDERNGERLHEG